MEDYIDYFLFCDTIGTTWVSMAPGMHGRSRILRTTKHFWMFNNPHVHVELILHIFLFEEFVRMEKCHGYFMEVVYSEIALNLSLQCVECLGVYRISFLYSVIMKSTILRKWGLQKQTHTTPLSKLPHARTTRHMFSDSNQCQWVGGYSCILEHVHPATLVCFWGKFCEYFDKMNVNLL